MSDEVARSRIVHDSGERFISLRRALGVEAFGLSQLTLQPGQCGRIHRHREQEEVYLVLSGVLTVLVEREPHELEEGDLLRLGPTPRRQLVNAGGERCVILAIGASGEHVGRDGEAFASWDDLEGRPPQEVPLPEDLPPGRHREGEDGGRNE
ncbi:MAG: cupin domain-containing protein [Actinomycetota bacterium]|nr:cupin domain-containing protein [Actinomycetota bacterium]